MNEQGSVGVDHPSIPANKISESSRPEAPSAEDRVLAPQSWIGDVRDVVESLIERYPWPTVLLGMGVGYLLTRWMR